ncbi:MAG: NADH-quinone oxidoreductase subunit A [Candidatus Cyclobacteriaceae bacterium M2_1C_046]
MYSEILIYLGVGCLFVAGGLITSKLIRPNRPNPEKLAIYESGEEPLGDARASFPVRYYVIALIFLLFEVEIIFLFPWALVFADEGLVNATAGRWGWLTFIEMMIFLTILIVGLAFAWKKGYLDWEVTRVEKEKFKGPVPQDLYKKFNERIDGTLG